MTQKKKVPSLSIKKVAAVVGLCIFLAHPVAGWARDDGDNWRDRSPKERENILKNYRRWQNLPPQDKEHLREEWNRWQNLPQDRRDQLKNRYEDMRRRRQNQN